MRCLVTATIIASCFASAACVSYTDHGRGDRYEDESSFGKGRRGDSKESGSSSNADDEASVSDIGDVAALPDGPVKTVTSRCDTASIGSGVRGNGEITRTTRDASGFEDVVTALRGTLVFEGAFDVVVQEGSTFRVQVETDANLQDVITIETHGDALAIGSTGSFCTNGLRVLVTMPKFHGAFLSGAGSFDITKRTGPSDVVLELSGAGDVRFRGNADQLRIDVSGAGDVLLENGSANETIVDVSGAGTVIGKNFDAGRVRKNVSGAGTVRL